MSTEEKSEAKVVARGQCVVTVRSGKQVALQFPVELTSVDVLDLISYLSTNFEKELTAARTQVVVPAKFPILKS